MAIKVTAYFPNKIKNYEGQEAHIFLSHSKYGLEKLKITKMSLGLNLAIITMKNDYIHVSIIVKEINQESEIRFEEEMKINDIRKIEKYAKNCEMHFHINEDLRGVK